MIRYHARYTGPNLATWQLLYASIVMSACTWSVQTVPRAKQNMGKQACQDGQISLAAVLQVKLSASPTMI